MGVALAGLHLGDGVHYATRFALEGAQVVHAGCLGKQGALVVELLEGDGLVGGAPGRGCDDLHAGVAAVVDVLNRDAVAYHVVPYGIHAATDDGVLVLELLVANLCGAPRVV